MYLKNATNLEEITHFGINPLLTLCDLFEDGIINNLEPGSRDYNLWLEIKAKVFMLQEISEKILSKNRLKKNR